SQTSTVRRISSAASWPVQRRINSPLLSSHNLYAAFTAKSHPSADRVRYVRRDLPEAGWQRYSGQSVARFRRSAKHGRGNHVAKRGLFGLTANEFVGMSGL